MDKAGVDMLFARPGILYNPTAGRGVAQDLADRLRTDLERLGHTPLMHATARAGDGLEWAQAHAGELDRLFVLGGDGSLREAAAGVMASGEHVALAHIPLGNANVVARELGIPLDPKQACQALLHGKAEPFDALAADGQLALAMVSVGFDAEAADWLDRARRGPLKRWYAWHGDSLYGAIGAARLLVPAFRRFEIEVDGKPLPLAATACLISNMRTYAKGWAAIPEANPQDGLLDFQAMRPRPVPSTLISMASAARQKPLPPWLAQKGQGKRLMIGRDSGFVWQADGDAMGRTNALFVEILPAALRLVRPK